LPDNIKNNSVESSATIRAINIPPVPVVKPVIPPSPKVPNVK